MVWDLTPFVPRTAGTVRLVFSHGFDDDTAMRTAKAYMYSRFHRAVVASHVTAHVKPLKLTGAVQELACVRIVMDDLRGVGAGRLSEVSRDHLVAVLAVWKRGSASSTASLVTTLKHISAHGPYLHPDALKVPTWPGRTAAAVAGRPPRPAENSTARIPEEIMAPLMRAAVFYVVIASKDILAARCEVRDLREAARRRPAHTHGRARADFLTFLAKRREAGRGLPALPLKAAYLRPNAPVADGVVQAPNISLIELMSGGTEFGQKLKRDVEAIAAEVGVEQGGLDTPMTIWAESGRPWRARLEPMGINREVDYLRTACWIVMAYLSGMRDVEVRMLGRDCAFTEPGDDGRIRHKIRGRVYKHRGLSGDEAEWVVLDIVHQAVTVLLELHDDPDYLFGYWGTENTGYQLTMQVPERLRRFRDHLNELFSSENSLFIPNDTSAVTLIDETEELDPEPGETATAPDTADEEERESEGIPWAFETRQFRRTVAWHIANQPFGVVAGTRQYQHARTAMFEGYAGTSESGFAAEVAANDVVARLDYLEDLYRDWSDGGASAGGAAARISAEFERIRRELGDLPGVVASPFRLRTMLTHLAKTLHPGVLNDCFYQAATAVCRKRAKALGRPLPLLNMCLSCPNARRSAVHLPRLTTARNQALTELELPKRDREALPRLQLTALTDFVAELDELIEGIRTTTSDEESGSRHG
ncbi:hypothetical protein [Streptomyces sp. NPDC087511]|uniref:hypothetical protein n=1 Tax=Streptomyces sp. NPDC087511 TaxID=3365792 RepID=UPI003804F0AC